MTGIVDVTRRVPKAFWPILGSALLLRLGFLLVHDPIPIVNDAVYYNELGMSLAEGQGYEFEGRPFLGREPGYPLWVSWVYRVFGSSPNSLYVVQQVAGALTVALVYFTATKLRGSKSGLVAAGFCAGSISLIAYGQTVLTESIAPLWVAIALLALVYVPGQSGSRKWLLILVAGASCGLAALNHANLGLLGLAAPFFLVAVKVPWHHALRQGGVVAAITVAAFVPWVVHNKAVSDTIVVTRTGTGDSIWAGSYIPWDGKWMGYRPEIQVLKNGLTEQESDERLIKETIKNIKKDPLKVAIVWLKKPHRMWLFNDAVGVSSPLSNGEIARVLAQQIIWAVCGLACLYAVLRFRRDAGVRAMLVMLIAVTLSILPVTSIYRYQTPLLPAVYVLAGIGVMGVVEAFKNRRHGYLTRTKPSDSTLPPC